jgi:hypothetical protein
LLAVTLSGFPAFCGTIELLTNGNFAGGNVGFSSGYTFVADALTSLGTCYPEGVYTIGTTPSSCHVSWASYTPFDSTGNMMIINGATNPTMVWSETVPVSQNRTYTFSAYVASSFPVSPADLVFSINGTQLGGNFAASSTPGAWTQFTDAWNSGNSTTAVLTIADANLAAYGNDYTLDSISFQENSDPTPRLVDNPEPSTMALMAGALFLLILVGRYRRNSAALLSPKSFSSRT